MIPTTRIDFTGNRDIQKTDIEDRIELSRSQRLALEVADEVSRARSMFPAIHSPHEGLAVIREEYLEFEDEVWQHNLFKKRDHRPQMRTELIQLAAMALRTILDTIDGGEQ